MDYISKRKNNIQSISIYCRPHQGLREEKPFCELPPVLLHPCSSQQTWHYSCSKGWELRWAGPGSPRGFSMPSTPGSSCAGAGHCRSSHATSAPSSTQPHWKANTWSIPKESITLKGVILQLVLPADVSEATQGCSCTETAQASHKPEK